MGSTAGLLPPSAVVALSSPFSFVLASDLWEPDDEDGRSSSGFGCINVNGNSATNSLKYLQSHFSICELRYIHNIQQKYISVDLTYPPNVPRNSFILTLY